MLIRDVVFRIYGDVAHDWRFVTVLAVIVLLICWLSAEGVISVGCKAERWIRRRGWSRSAKRAARARMPVLDAAAPSAGEQYPEQLPEPGVAQLRDTRSARRVLWAQVDQALIEAARNRRDA